MFINEYSDIINECIEELENVNRIDIYTKKGASEGILKLLKYNTNPKIFGCFLEKIIKKSFCFNNSENSEHDFIYTNDIGDNLKIELKSSCLLLKDLLNDKYTYQYNSVRLNYDYNYLMVCNIGLQDLDFYIIKKEKLLKHIELLNLKQKKLKSNILELITFKRLENVLTKITPKMDLNDIIN